MTHPNHGSRDQFIIAALESGYITVNTETGMVYDRYGDPKTTSNHNAYHTVYLGNRQLGLVHRVVWIAAHGAIDAELEVNHINSDRGDNRLSNLELVTHMGNSEHYSRSVKERFERIEQDRMFRLTTDDVLSVDPEFLLRLIHRDETLLVDRGRPDNDEPAPSHRIYSRPRANRMDPNRK